MKKKLLSLLLAACMVIAMLPTGVWGVENGITKGTSDTTFSPDAPCTRGQIVTFLYRDLAK